MRENGEGGESTGRALRLMQVRIKEGDGEGRFGGNVLGHLQSKEGPTRLSGSSRAKVMGQGNPMSPRTEPVLVLSVPAARSHWLGTSC